MRFFANTKIDFVGKRKVAFVISTIIILAGIVSLVINGGPKYNIDFTGGLQLELDMNVEGQTIPQIDDIRSAFEKNGLENLEIQNSEYEGKQYFIVKTKQVKFEDRLAKALASQFKGLNAEAAVEKIEKVADKLEYKTEINLNSAGSKFTEDDVKTALAAEGFSFHNLVVKSNTAFYIEGIKQTGTISDKVIEVVKKAFPNNVSKNLIRMQQEIGPRIGDELRGKAIWAILFSLFGIILYIWWRFQFSFGIAAVIALFHDVMITVGIFSLLGKEISLPIVAALLTIVGYSLNDTIVVFDRIREDMRIYRKEKYKDVINHSINETLSRTVITSLTTLLVVLSVFFFGGNVIHDLSFALLVGVIAGTYSSIFIASPILVQYFSKQAKLAKK